VKRLRHAIEYAAARFALGLLDLFPLAWSEALFRGIADLFFLIHGTRRRVAIDNILKSGITASPEEARRIARASFRHFAVLVVESLKTGGVFSEEHWEEQVEIELPPETRACLEDQEQGVILASGHLGNWEVAAQLISFMKPVVGITRTMNNPKVEELVQRRKPRNRFRLTPKHASDRGRFLQIIKDGEVLALMIDQHAGSRGMVIDFFGRPASTQTSVAMLHLLTRAPLCFGYCVRTGPLQYRLHAGKPLAFERTGNRQDDVRRILEALTRDLEEAVRLYPEQYLWGHRRWKVKHKQSA
jgi:KDO2-lipid IV(A) lauroyltransferase